MTKKTMIPTKRQSIKDKLNETFDMQEAEIAEEKAIVEYKAEQESANDDFKSARTHLHKIAEKGMDVLDELIEIAKERQNARDFEVVAQFLKVNADVAKDMIRIHKEKKELEITNNPPTIETPNGLTQNNTTIFVGSTADLLKQMNKEQEDAKVIDAEVVVQEE